MDPVVVLPQVPCPLAGTNPAPHNANFALSLHNLAVSMRDLGRDEEALPIIVEAVQPRRALPTTDSQARNPGDGLTPSTR